MKTINLNGKDVQLDMFLLVTARASLRILATGLKIRNVNLKIIKTKLSEVGVKLKGRTAKECLEEVIELIELCKK